MGRRGRLSIDRHLCRRGQSPRLERRRPNGRDAPSAAAPLLARSAAPGAQCVHIKLVLAAKRHTNTGTNLDPICVTDLSPAEAAFALPAGPRARRRIRSPDTWSIAGWLVPYSRRSDATRPLSRHYALPPPRCRIGKLDAAARVPPPPPTHVHAWVNNERVLMTPQCIAATSLP